MRGSPDRHIGEPGNPRIPLYQRYDSEQANIDRIREYYWQSTEIGEVCIFSDADKNLRKVDTLIDHVNQSEEISGLLAKGKSQFEMGGE